MKKMIDTLRENMVSPEFPPSRSNEISYEYYAFLKGQIASGTMKKCIFRASYRGYETYHLLDIR